MRGFPPPLQSGRPALEDTIGEFFSRVGNAHHLLARFYNFKLKVCATAAITLELGQLTSPPAEARRILSSYYEAGAATSSFFLGHATGYVLQLAQQKPQTCSRIVLVAPTWRGPLPTMGASQSVAGAVRQLVRSPLLGQAFYKLNTTPSFLSWMYRRHVYTRYWLNYQECK